jgi:hypothetical protein
MEDSSVIVAVIYLIKHHHDHHGLNLEYSTYLATPSKYITIFNLTS